MGFFAFLRRSFAVNRAVLASATLFTVSCAAILGIEDAETDPQLQGGNGGGGGGDLCTQYCEEVTVNCTEQFSQYSGIAVCTEVCSRFPAGDANEANPIGNTIACRYKNAKEAAPDLLGPQDECEGAGPGSDGACSNNCEAWCLLFQSLCEPEFQDVFSNQGDCRTFCDDEIPTLNEPFSSNQTMGDHILCRLYHVSQAVLDRDTHCPHAAGIDGPCLAMGGGGMGGAGGGAAGAGGN